MNSKPKRFASLSLVAVLVLVICGAFLAIEARTKVLRRWADEVLYDNRYHYLPCEQLPPITEVERVLREHQDIIAQIEAVNPGQVGVEIHPCGTGENADITFWYASHQDRKAIEQIIGSDTFFGVPYNLNNR